MESRTTTEISTYIAGKTREGRAYPQTHTGNVRIQTTGPHLRTCKPVSKGSRERAIKLVGGRSELHVEANPKQGTQSANGTPNHYRNINMSRRENSEGQSLPPNARGQRTHTNDRTPYMNANLSGKRATRGLWNSWVVGTKCTSDATPNRARRAQTESQTAMEI